MTLFPLRWIRHSYPTFTPTHHLNNVTYKAPLEARSVSLNQVVEKLPFYRELKVPLLVPQERYVNPNHTSQSIYEAPSEAGTKSLNHLEKLPYNSELKDSLLASREGHFNPSRTPHSSSPFQTTFDTEAGIPSLDHLEKLPYRSELKGPLLVPQESYSYPPTHNTHPNHNPHPTYEAETEAGIVSLNHLEELPYKQLKGPILAPREGYSSHPNQNPHPTYEAPEEAGIVSLDHMEELTRLEIIHLVDVSLRELEFQLSKGRQSLVAAEKKSYFRTLTGLFLYWVSLLLNVIKGHLKVHENASLMLLC